MRPLRPDTTPPPSGRLRIDAIRTAERAPRAVCVVVVLLLSTQMAVAQEEGGAVGEAVKLIHTSAVRAGVVRGAVVDSAGSPLVGAQVFLDGTRVGTLSDSLGLFRLEAPSAGGYTLRVRLIGYAEKRASLELGGPRGIGALIRLPLSDLRLCPLSSGPWQPGPFGAARAYVREILAGQGPPTVVALRVRDENGDEYSYRADGSGSRSVYLAAGEGLGPFDVEITAVGYEPWTRTGVVIEADQCGWITSDPLQAWLLPAADSNGGV